QNGLVRSSRASNGRLTYQIAGEDHHHMICRVCGSEMEIQHTLLEDFYSKLESISGYLRIDSHVTFFGVCPKCQ
ncbi:MAG TPA: transcriptional repressor, partial [Anaerolineales bacterium]|nr:transcriptional repressor [Anaerolineales bacterium]